MLNDLRPSQDIQFRRMAQFQAELESGQACAGKAGEAERVI